MNQSKKFFEEKFGEGKYVIEATLLTSGDDITIIINGGTDYHIGALAFSTLDKNSLENKTSAKIGVLKAINHKEDELCKKYAIFFSEKFDVSVAVIAGIHIDNATTSEIKKLLENIDIVLNNLANKLKQDN